MSDSELQFDRNIKGSNFFPYPSLRLLELNAINKQIEIVKNKIEHFKLNFIGKLLE